MYTMLIGVAIFSTGLALFTRWWDRTNSRYANLALSLAIPLLVLGLLAAFLIPAILGENPLTYESVTTSRVDIVALKDNTITEGRIGGGVFVMSGYISEEPVYFFYKRAGSGFVQDYIKAKGITIYEDTEPGVGYIMTVTTVERVDPIWKRKYLHWLVFMNEQSRYTTTEIHIPKGTIIHEFRLDAE